MGGTSTGHQNRSAGTVKQSAGADWVRNPVMTTLIDGPALLYRR